jgi:hypothetical protein
MVDPGIAQVIIKHLNRWYRSRSRPQGVTDHYFRGTRMSYNSAYRLVNCLTALFLLSIAALLYVVPDIFAGKPLWEQWLVKLGWVGITVVAVLAPLQAFREFTAVNDDGLIKSNLFGKITRLEWREITFFSLNADDNKVVFRGAAKNKLTMSLCYNGWQDFQEMAARRMEPGVYWQVNYGLANVKANDQRQSAKASPKKKWFRFGRKR